MRSIKVEDVIAD